MKQTKSKTCAKSNSCKSVAFYLYTWFNDQNNAYGRLHIHGTHRNSDTRYSVSANQVVTILTFQIEYAGDTRNDHRNATTGIHHEMWCIQGPRKH